MRLVVLMRHLIINRGEIVNRASIAGIINTIKKGKSIPRALLDAWYNFINDEYDVDSINVK